jgi:hypothetical protein
MVKNTKTSKTSQLEFQPNFQVPLVVSLPSLPSSEVRTWGTAVRKTWKKMGEKTWEESTINGGFHGKIIYKSKRFKGKSMGKKHLGKTLECQQKHRTTSNNCRL